MRKHSEFYTIRETVERIRINLSSLDKFPLWILPLLFSILFFHTRAVSITPDSAWYITLSLNLYQGLGFLGADWSPVVARPVFPGLIAIFFWLFGVSVKSALWVVRFFFVLNVCLVYAMGTRFFNRMTGLIAALLVLTSYTIHFWASYILLDTIVLFFLLLVSLLLFMAFENKKDLYFGLAGFVLGITFLTKEVAILLWPLPVLLWVFVPAYRVRRAWRGILIFWAVTLVLIIPWFVYVHFTGNDAISSNRTFVGTYETIVKGVPSLAEGNDSEPSSALSLWLSILWSWLQNYYRLFLAPNFVLAPLFLVAWAYVCLKAIGGGRPERLLLSGVILFLPIILFQGWWGSAGSRQSLYFYGLSYLALARMIWVVEGNPTRHKAQLVFGFSMAVVCIAIQIWVGRTGLVRILPDISFGRNDWAEVGWHEEPVQAAGEWLRENTAPGEAILMDWHLANSIYFYSDARQPIYQISYVSSRDIDSFDQSSLAPVLFVWPYYGRTYPSNPLMALSEPQFLAQVQELDIKYVIVTSLRNFLTLYLRANPGFEEVGQFGQGQIKIFKVRDPVAPIEFPIHIEPRTIKYLQEVVKADPALYERLVEDYLVKKLGADRKSVEKMVIEDVYGIGHPIEVNRIY